MIYETIGRRIALFRKERGLMAQELAERVGLSQGQISLLENGKQGLRSETLLRIAEALGVPPVQFFMPMGEEGETATELCRRRVLRGAAVAPPSSSLSAGASAPPHRAMGATTRPPCGGECESMLLYLLAAHRLAARMSPV